MSVGEVPAFFNFSITAEAKEFGNGKPSKKKRFSLAICVGICFKTENTFIDRKILDPTGFLFLFSIAGIILIRDFRIVVKRCLNILPVRTVNFKPIDF
jgi:hypothetical protein